MHFALDEAPEFAAPVRGAQRPEHAGVDRHLQHAGGSSAAVGGLPARNRARRPDGRLPDSLAERSRPRARGQARRIGVRAVVPDRGRRGLRRGEGRDGSAGDRQDHPVGAQLRTQHQPAHHLHAQAHGRDVRRPGRRLLPRPVPRASRSAPTGPGRKAFSDSRFQSTGFTWPAPDATAGRGSRSSRDTTRPIRRWPTPGADVR